jgi:U3 small nucleolar RNA-associated protein 13
MVATELQAKVTYRARSKLEVFYTGGAAVVTKDGKHIVCACADEVKVGAGAMGRRRPWRGAGGAPAAAARARRACRLRFRRELTPPAAIQVVELETGAVVRTIPGVRRGALQAAAGNWLVFIT